MFALQNSPLFVVVHWKNRRRLSQIAFCLMFAAAAFALVPMVQAAGPFGIVGEWDWVDMIKGVGSWNTVGSATTVPQDSRGFPMSDFGATIFDSRKNMPYRGPDTQGINEDYSGVYQLTFQGSATIAANTEVSGGVQVVNQAYDPSTNITTAGISVMPGYGLLQLTFTNTKRTAKSAAGSGLTFIRLIRPGYGPNDRSIFTKGTLKTYSQPYAAIRFLEEDGSGDYNTFYGPDFADQTVAKWADRVLTTDAYQAGLPSRNVGGKQSAGVAWEYMIQLANQTHHDMWINIPVIADDDYVQQLANLILNGNAYTPGLDKNLKVYIELENEVWSGANQSYIANLIQANNEGITVDQRFIEHSISNGKIFQKVFGENEFARGRVRPLAFWQYTQQLTFFTAIGWWEQHYGDKASKYLFGIGEAPYYNAPDGSTVDAVFDSQYTNSDGTRRDFIGWQAVASYYGLKEAGYESGPSLTIDAEGLADHDPRIIPSIVHHYLDNWYAVGGDIVEYFNLQGSVSKFGDYEQVEDFEHLDTPTYAAAKQVFNAPQPVVTAGQVLPWAVGQSVTIDPSQIVNPPFSGDAVPGSGLYIGQGSTNVYLLRSTGPGTFTITLTAQGSSSGTPLDVYVDDAKIGTVSFGTSLAKSASLSFTVSSVFNGLSLVETGSNNVYFPAGTGAITITRTGGAGGVYPPSAPANLTATPGDGKVSLIWASTASATSYEVRRSTTSGGPYGKIAVSATNSYVDTTAANGATYYYSIRAVNAGGSGGLSPQVSAFPAPASVPSAPGGVTLQTGGGDFNVFFGTGIGILSWSPVSNAAAYNVYSSSDGSTFNQIAGPQVGTTYIDRTLSNGTPAYYAVTAVNYAGESSKSNVASGTPVEEVRQPPVLSIETRTGYTFLHWVADPLANPQFGTAFNVKRSTQPGGPYTTIVQINTDDAFDYTATPGTAYYYVVTATNGSGESAPSNEVSGASEKLHVPGAGGGDTTPNPVL